MNWYYADAGKQAGPVSDEQLDELFRSGKLPPETLVWCDGMSGWQPYQQVRASSVGAPPAAAPPPEPAAPPPASAPASSAGAWHYDDSGKPTGPVSDAELAALVAAGKVRGDTRVWREGMANWQPYSQVTAAGAGGGSATDAAGGVVCAECNRVFPKDSVIKYGAVWVCGGCKPVFVQKLREGATLPAGGEAMTYAGFWIRLGAVFVDGLILWVVGVMMGLVAGLGFMTSMGANPNPEFSVVQIVVMLLQMVAGIVYETFFLGRFGATPGKMACGLRVVTADGARISYARACGRYFGKILSYMTCTIGFIIAGFDQEKRALHDHICNTRVIYK